MGEAVLGISAYFHDSAAALLIDGKIVAAVQEERFTRIRHDAAFPRESINHILEETGISIEQLSLIVFYEKQFIKFERLIDTYHALAPQGFLSFITAIPLWIKKKLFLKKKLKEELSAFGKVSCPIHFPEHHLSHAASAFFPSPFEEAAILTIDGVGEWATTTIGHGKGNAIEVLEELHFPHSIGLLYSAFTFYAGFRVNSGEYKLMGLAPYGHPGDPQTLTFMEKIKEYLVDIKPDGSILLNMDYFNFASGLSMVHDRRWEKLFGMPARLPESQITQEYMNLACAIQLVTEEIVLKLVATAKRITGCRNLTMAGGVALNCVANSKVLKSGYFDELWIQPAAGDAGGALGAALAGWHISLNKDRIPLPADQMEGAYLGPEFSEKDVRRMANRYQAVFEYFPDFNQLTERVAEILDHGKVTGWFQGRMEFGPRALGNRSILGDARDPEMQKRLNIKIKGREGFRPFAPAILEEDISLYFCDSLPSPYMLFVSEIRKELRHPLPEDCISLPLMERINCVRSTLPAITHIDLSARVQTVNQRNNRRFYDLLHAFKNRTGCSVLINTSFNVRGEPIVCNPYDAYRCFMATEMDFLVIGNILFDKRQQAVSIKPFFSKSFEQD